MDYQESRAYIKDAEKYGSILGLTNMKEMMRRLGNPQDDLKYVHVAGTNGKGSVIAYLYTTLTEAGYRVGRYISPALYSYRERMETAGASVSREKFAEYLTKVAEVIDGMTADGLPHPTPFEIETAVAFLFFQDEKCDLVLLEVGMGGDLDATNIIRTTELAVLVSISIDHQSFLGNTVEEIAQKKAGIIKEGCRAVSVHQLPEAEEVIRETCGHTSVPLVIADAKDAQILKAGFEGQTFSYEGNEYEISLAGIHQIENAVLALNALAILDDCGYQTTLSQRKCGLKKTCWGGRFTVISHEPLFVVDGAHNPAAARVLASSVEQYFKDRRIIYIMGVFADKDYRTIIETTVPYAEKILAIETPDNPRAMPVQELAQVLRQYHSDVEAMNDIRSAVETAFCYAGKEDVILAFGSLSFIGEISRIVRERGERKND